MSATSNLVAFAAGGQNPSGHAASQATASAASFASASFLPILRDQGHSQRPMAIFAAAKDGKS
jgi:hypothetical protein